MESVWDKYALPFMSSITVHALVVAAMLFAMPEPKPKSTVKKPNYVQAKLITLEAQSQAQPAKPKPKIVDLTRQREEERRRAAQEAQEKARQEAQEQEKQAQARQQQRKKEAEQQAKAAAEKKAAEQQAQAEAERREQEKVRREEAEADRRKREQQIQQQEIFEDALQEEEEALAEAEYAATAQSYISVISQRIEQNWSRPPSARNNMQCELLIKLVPTGRVISVDIVQSSGNDQFDRSAVQAVNRAEQFPEIREMKPEVFERYYRELRLVFNPQDLRQ